MSTNIQQLIKSLETEIRSGKNDLEREERLLRLQQMAAVYEGEDKIISSDELVEDIKSRPPREIIKTGIPGLDLILEGFSPQQLVILSGITKHGKTSFAMFLTGKLLPYNPVWFPFEESAEELVYKFLERGQTPPLFFFPKRMKDKTVDWIEQRIVEAKAKYDCRIVFIDHLHFINMPGENLSQAIGTTVRKLREIATTWNVTIVLLAHLRKTELNKNPNLEELKDSSSIAQEADTVIFMWRQTTKDRDGEVKITNNVNVSVQANRRTGKTGNVKMVFDNGDYREEKWKDETLESYFPSI